MWKWLLLLAGCDAGSQPTSVSMDISPTGSLDGRWHVTVNVYIDAPSRSEAARRAAGMLEAMGKAVETPPVPAEKLESIPKGEGDDGSV